MREAHHELLTSPIVSAVKCVPYAICNSEVKKTAGQQYKIKGANVMNTITIMSSSRSPATEIQPTWNETRELLNI